MGTDFYRSLKNIAVKTILIQLERLKPIKEILPENISYEDIRIVIAKNQLEY